MMLRTKISRQHSKYLDAEDQAEDDKSDLNDNLGCNSNPVFTSDQCCQSQIAGNSNSFKFPLHNSAIALV
jgi:hypothetical protein